MGILPGSTRIYGPKHLCLKLKSIYDSSCVCFLRRVKLKISLNVTVRYGSSGGKNDSYIYSTATAL
jgi:hypothetical protein